jgi:hypothetical protein
MPARWWRPYHHRALCRYVVAFGRLCLAARRLIGGAAIGIVFLIGDDPGLVIQFQTHRTNMGIALGADKLRWLLVADFSPCLNQHDAQPVVHYLQGRTLR